MPRDQLALLPSRADDILARAHARQDRRARVTPRIDYAALNVMVRRQRAALTRAINSHDRELIITTVHDAVTEWSRPGAMWPDDWPAWQIALDDALPWTARVDLHDLL